MSDIWVASLIVLWIVVLVLVFFVAGSLRLIGLMQLRLGTDPGALITESGLDRGQVAPDFQGSKALTGEMLRLSDLATGPTFVGFLSPSCFSCEEFAMHLNEVAKTRSRDFGFAAVCRGDRASCSSFVSRTKLQIPVVVDETGSIEQAYEIALTPFGYVLDGESRVLIRGVATTWTQLEALLAQQGTPGANVRIVEVEHKAAASAGDGHA
jgi:methylamine dehydrogenase accessory protein MauD